MRFYSDEIAPTTAESRKFSSHRPGPDKFVPLSAKNRVKSRSFFRVFPSREIRVARTSHRARTHGTNVAHGACEASHAAEPSTSRGRETRTHTRAAHLAPVFGESPDNGSRPRTSSHAMPAVSKAGAGAPKRAAAAPAIVEDPSTLVPCPVITAHPNGFVERTEPERETHEVRCVLPTRSSVFPTTAHRAARTRARRAARPARRIAPRAEKIRRAASPSTRARGSPRTRRYAARADRASPHPPDRTVSPTRGAFRICARVAEDDATSPLNTRTEKNPKLTVRFTRPKTSPAQRVQTRQEEAFVQPGGVDVRQGFFRQAFRRERR